MESDKWIPSCHGSDLSLFELYRRKHLKRTVTTLAIVEDLKVFKDHVGEFHPGTPPLSIQKLDLHPSQNDSITALS